MDVLTAVVVGALLAFFTAVQAWINKGRFDALEKRLDRVEAEVAELRGMILQLAIAVGIHPRPQTS
jgi:hypothetical protein